MLKHEGFEILKEAKITESKLEEVEKEFDAVDAAFIPLPDYRRASRSRYNWEDPSECAFALQSVPQKGHIAFIILDVVHYPTCK